MTTPPQPAPPKPEPINIILRLILLIMVVVPATVCYVFFFGRLWGPIALTINLVLMPVLVVLIRRRRIAKSKRISEVAEALGGKPSDDPRQMANFM
jgi:hypothetical protein